MPRTPAAGLSLAREEVASGLIFQIAWRSELCGPEVGRSAGRSVVGTSQLAAECHRGEVNHCPDTEWLTRLTRSCGENPSPWHSHTLLLGEANMKYYVILCLGCFATAASPAFGDTLDQYDAPPAGSVRIIRDTFGVPHIIARDEVSLFYGVGLAQAKDQLENLQLNYLRAVGRSAEREGRASLAMDQLARQLRIEHRSREQYVALDATSRQHLDSFARGINDYIEARRDQLPDWIEPVEPFHVLALSNFVEIAFCVGHCRGDLARAGIRLAKLDIPSPDDTLSHGSNQFAIAPSRSATGAAMLSMDPHLLLSGFYRWYEMHLVGPNLNVMGASFFGTPYVSMGRTERSAWSMTVNGPDLGDVFAFEIDPENPTRYRGLEGWESFESHDEICYVREGEQLIEVPFTVQQTTLGPVMAVRDNVAYVFALPWAESAGRVQQIVAMARARTLDEFKQALSQLGIVMFNIVYADADGDIYYVSNGRVPRRDTRIASHDIRPGHESWARWQGYHDLSELPQVTNPPCGFLMNTNSGPQNVCLDVAPQPEDYPPYMMSQPANSRSRRLWQLLISDESITWSKMADYATDTYLIHADEWLPRLVDLLHDPAAAEGTDAARLRDVASVLTAWDRRTDVASQGAVLYVLLFVNGGWITPLESGDRAAAARRIVQVANRIEQQFGELNVPWGQYSRIRRGDVDEGVAGNGIRGGNLGDLTALRPTYGISQGARKYAVGGSSYGQIVDFSDVTRSISCLPFGISEDPNSPHFADQLPLYREAQFKPTWFLSDELKQNTTTDQTVTLPASGG